MRKSMAGTAGLRWLVQYTPCCPASTRALVMRSSETAKRPRPLGGLARSHHQRPGTCGATRGVLHEPAQPGGSGHGFAHDQSGIGSRKRAGAVRDGGITKSESAARKLIFSV